MEGNDTAGEALLQSERLRKDAVSGVKTKGPRSISFLKFFTFTTCTDRLLLCIGSLGAVIAGAILPSISIVMGNVANAFSTETEPEQSTSLLDTMSTVAAIVMMIAMALFIFSYIFYAFWQHLAENIVLDLRKRYIAALMRQEIAYFELNRVEQIPAEITEIFDTCKSSIGEKTANLIFAVSTCVFGIVYALIYGPIYAAVCIAYLPLLMAIIAVFGKLAQNSTLRKLDVVKQLGGVAEETLAAIKVVACFTREERELRKFTRHAQEAQSVAKVAVRRMALAQGLIKFSIFFFYAYTLYVGSFFIEWQKKDYNNRVYNQQIVIQTIIALITGFVGLIAALPNVQGIAAATALGVLIFDVIERNPEVANGPVRRLDVQLTERIDFANVSFKYPTAPAEHRPVLVDASFSIRAGQTTAIVGPSGSGKSTIVQLVERFYDPQPGGAVRFDDCDIRNIDLKALRESIGYVSQEPVLILGTIRDNLLYGNRDAVEEDMIEAIRQANAQFVLDQENGLDTFVGTSGITNMSGGQKQRIAIARALIKKPKILILDEATSALDPKSEIEVQEAIEAISRSGLQLTILIIAHRLTTIASADNLLYFQSRSNLISASKGTPEYESIFEKLKSISYACGDAGVESSGSESEPDDSDGLNEADRIRIQSAESQQEARFSKHTSLNLNPDCFPTSTTEPFTSSSHPGPRRETKLQVPSDGNSLNADHEITIETTQQQTGGSDYSFPLCGKNGKVSDIARGGTPEDPSGNQLYSSSPYTKLIEPNTRRVATDNADQRDADRSSLHRRREPRRQSISRAGSKATLVSASALDLECELDFTKMESQDPETYREVSFAEIMAYQRPRYHAVIGLIASLFASLNLPLFGFVLSKFIFVLAIDPVTEREEFDRQRNIWTLAFVGLCLAIGLSTGIQKLCFGIGGENLTLSLRAKLFEAILRKNVGWFDNKYRAPGILTNIIAEDINAINGLTTETFGIAAEAALGLFLSCLVCFIFSVRLALVVSATCPFMVLGGLGMSKLQFNQSAVDASFKQANALLSDIIINYRTVISFGDKNVQFMLDRYNALLVIPHTAGVKRAHISGLFFAYSQSIRFAFVAFIFYVAAVFVNRYGLDPEAVFTGCYVVFVGSIGSGVSISQMPSISKAKAAARTVFGIIEEPSLIDPKQPGEQKIPTGAIEFKNVYFRYPSRNKYVLRNFNLSIKPNQSVAIVGHSGSGKSTIASLLLRFYDAQRGAVLIDDVNIADFDLERYRNYTGVVQQEPLLFDETIKSNILFGDLTADDARIREAAVQANALGFIMQSDEDFSSPTVQARAREQFLRVAKAHLNPNKHPNLSGILQQVGQQSLGAKELTLLNQLLPIMSNIGLERLEHNSEDLLAALRAQSLKQDCTWQHVLRSFTFEPEARKILDYLKILPENPAALDQGSNECWSSEDIRKEVIEAIHQNSCQFDLGAVTAYRDALLSGKNVRFTNYLRSDRQRVEEVFQAVIDSCVNQVSLKESERQLDPGFLKMCGLKGSKLSGGQKQRIAIARALIKNPRLMILDEATSALDEQSQEIVQQALDRAMDGRTSVVIAHRMSTIKKCDRIVVVHKGKVVEDGTYEELSAKPNGHFAKLEKGVE